MSEFLMVVPDGYESVDLSLFGYGEEDITRWIADRTWYDFDNALEVTGMLPAGKAVVDARLFRDRELLSLWVKLGAA